MREAGITIYKLEKASSNMPMAISLKETSKMIKWKETESSIKKMVMLNSAFGKIIYWFNYQLMTKNNITIKNSLTF